MNAEDLVDTRLLRRLTLTAGALLVIGSAVWLFGRGSGALPAVGVALMLLALAPLGMLLVQLGALRRAAERAASISTT